MQEYINQNDVLRAVQAKLIAQTAKGVQKYGHSVIPDKLETVTWIEHAQEELIDLLVYLECLKQKIYKL